MTWGQDCTHSDSAHIESGPKLSAETYIELKWVPGQLDLE